MKTWNRAEEEAAYHEAHAAYYEMDYDVTQAAELAAREIETRGRMGEFGGVE